MSLNGSVSPEQLVILRQALDDYCRMHGLGDGPERDYVADQIMNLFARGARTLEEVSKALAGPERRQA